MTFAKENKKAGMLDLHLSPLSTLKPPYPKK